jgi:hypothetical protein
MNSSAVFPRFLRTACRFGLILALLTWRVNPSPSHPSRLSPTITATTTITTNSELPPHISAYIYVSQLSSWTLDKNRPNCPTCPTKRNGPNTPRSLGWRTSDAMMIGLASIVPQPSIASSRASKAPCFAARCRQDERFPS